VETAFWHSRPQPTVSIRQRKIPMTYAEKIICSGFLSEMPKLVMNFFMPSMAK
jgi:hypothetical protein